MRVSSPLRVVLLVALAIGPQVARAQSPLAGPITNAANGHWYYLLAPANWNDAEQIAVSLSGRLATINNAAENEWVFANFSNFGGVERALWLGLNDAAQEQSWSWVSGEAIGFLNWSPGQPTGTVTTLADENYAMMWPPGSGAPAGSWNDAAPETLNYGVVEVGAPEPPPPAILAGPVTNSANGHAYYLLNYFSWPAAEQIAGSLGGHLATINDTAENQWLFETFSGCEGGKRAMWIGLNDSAAEATWSWANGEPVAYLNWAPGEPNSGAGVFPDEDHALIWNATSSFSPGTWNDAGSNQLHSAIVEISTPPTPVCFSAAADFSTNRNPNGAWRYGYRHSLYGFPKLHEESGALGNLGFWRTEAWQGVPAVLHNPTGATVTNETTVLAPGEMVFQPGPDGEYCVIAFTAPLKGMYQLACRFAGADPVGTTTDVRVAQGGVEVFAGVINGFGIGSGLAYATNFALRANERVDFIVGPGANGNSSNDATTLAAALCWLSNTPPTITSQPANLTVKFGINATFRVSAVDNGPLAYQWRFNGTNLIARTNTALDLSGVQFNQAGAYAVEVRGSAGVVTSTPATLTVLSLAPPPTISSQPTNLSVYVGGNAAFRVFASGQGPLSYQWRFHSANLVGATNSVLELTGVQFTQAGPYSVLVSNPGGSTASAQAMLAVQALPPPPTITTQPTNLAVNASSNATFRVTAAGVAPLAYQWRFNGTNLVGRTTSVLTLTSVQFSQAGPYTVVITNLGGAVTSSPAILAVNPLPPCANVFSNLVSWWRAEANTQDSWGPNNGSTSTKFAAGKVGQALASYFAVPDSLSFHFTNELTLEMWVNSSGNLRGLATFVSRFDYGGRVPSARNSSYFFGLTNNNPIFIISTNGSPVTNVSTLVADQPLPTNQWCHVAATFDGAAMRIYLNGQVVGERDQTGSLFDGSAMVGLGGLPYSQSFVQILSGSLDEISLYDRALAPAEIQSIHDAGIAGKCLQPPTVLAQPANQSVPAGEDVKFTLTAVGNQPLRYQWRFHGTNLAGATNSALVVEKVQANRAGNYSVFLSNALGVTISSNAALTLLPAPTCLPEPADRISWWPLDGAGADASGSNRLFLFNGARLVAGKVGSALEFPTNMNAYAVASNHPSLNFDSNVDFTIELWIKPALGDGAYPETPLLDKRSLSSTLAGYALSLYRGKLGFWASSPGAPPASFISTGPNLRDGMFHHVAVTLSRQTTNGGNLFVDGQPVLTFDPTPLNRNLSNSSPLYLSRGNDALSPYVGWMDEPAIYNRALSAAEILALRNAGAAGKCKVPPSILIQPLSQRVTVGSNVTFSVVASGSPALRYQWLTGLIGPPTGAITGATNSSFSFTIPDRFGSFAVRVTNLFGSVVSSTAVLTINNVPEAFPNALTLDEDTSKPITLLGSDRNNDPLLYLIVTPPAHGTLSGTGAEVVYNPSPNYNGPDSFTFKVNDGLVDSAPATVNITVQPVNDPPIACDQSRTLDEDTTAIVQLTANDADGDPLTFAVVTPPTHGVFNASGYTPNTNYFGPDSFTFQVSDGQTNSHVATVSLTIRPVNDAPVAEIVVAPLSHLPGISNRLVIAPVGTDATVFLDGSRSTDVENDPLQFRWSEGTNVFAQGLLATNAFAPGRYTITLIVSDGPAADTNSVELEIRSPVQAVAVLRGLVEDSSLAGNHGKPLQASLRAAAASFEHGNASAGLNQLQAFQSKVVAQIAPDDPVLARLLDEAAQEIIDALSAPAGPGFAADAPISSTEHAGKFRMRFHAPRGHAYFIAASTDLRQWQIIGLARATGSGQFEFEDRQAQQFPGRFYRITAP